MAFSGYLKIEDIPGESERSDHIGEINLSSFSWGVSRHTYRDTGGKRESGLPEVQSLVCTKDYDCASPYLALACLKAKNLGEVVLTLRKDAGDDHKDYLTITMTNVLIESYQTSGGGGGNPVDSIVLSFNTIHQKYIQEDTDLLDGGEHEMEYDILAAE